MSLVIGLTGSIAVGKSTVSHYLITKGYTVLDADKITHDGYKRGTKCFEAVSQAFDCLDEYGEIDRKKLGQIVFNDENAKKQLEDIVHPYVVDCLKQGIADCQDDIVFLDIPLLFEANLEYLCDKIIVVYVDEQTQLKRLMKRNRINKQQAKLLINQQMSILKKKEMADYVIDNNVYFEDLYMNIDKVVEVIKNENLFK